MPVVWSSDALQGVVVHHGDHFGRYVAAPGDLGGDVVAGVAVVAVAWVDDVFHTTFDDDLTDVADAYEVLRRWNMASYGLDRVALVTRRIA